MGTCPTCRTTYTNDILLCPNDGDVIELRPGEDPLVGQILAGRYKLETRLGEGGMGVVYRATHVMLGKAFAIKLIKAGIAPPSPDSVGRFRREARLLAELNHPNIVPVVDLGETPDRLLYFAMEVVEGPTLAEVIRRSGPLEPGRIARLLRQVTSALAQAHRKSIIHRDLKPQNIVLATNDDGSEVPKLLDFGIAKSFDEATTRIATTNFAIGTPHYMSPEQALNREVDARSDLYAVGVILLTRCSWVWFRSTPHPSMRF